MAKKRDLKQVEAVAKKYGIDPTAFGQYLEDCKEHGDRGTLNDRGDFTWDQLCEKAEEFKGS
jgi:hypothetical protein